MEYDLELDARQLTCPLPILRAKRSLAQLQAGQVLRIVATDPKSPEDFDAFCQQTGNVLLSGTEKNGEYIFYIRRRSA